ncbi:MAG: hypothetical protein ACLTCI_10145 [[Clostridium] nexile]
MRRLYGISGSVRVGKTTLCSLIPRFYDVSESIQIDGMDIRHIKLADLRAISELYSRMYLFAGTIMDNIIWQSKCDDEEVIRAAKRANAHEFIMSFPEGYDTDIGQRGRNCQEAETETITCVLEESTDSYF